MWDPFLNIMLFLLPFSTEKIVGIETPKDPPGHWLAAWCFSIGEESVNVDVGLEVFFEKPNMFCSSALYWKILPKEEAVCAPFVQFSTYNCYQK